MALEDLNKALAESNRQAVSFGATMEQLTNSMSKMNAGTEEERKKHIKEMQESWKKQKKILEEEMRASVDNVERFENLSDELARSEHALERLSEAVDESEDSFRQAATNLNRNFTDLSNTKSLFQNRSNELKADWEYAKGIEDQTEILQSILAETRIAGQATSGGLSVLGGMLGRGLNAVSPELTELVSLFTGPFMFALNWWPIRQFREHKKALKREKRDRALQRSLLSGQEDTLENRRKIFSQTSSFMEKAHKGSVDLLGKITSKLPGVPNDWNVQMEDAFLGGFFNVEERIGELSSAIGEMPGANENQKRLRQEIDTRNQESRELRKELSGDLSDKDKQIADLTTEKKEFYAELRRGRLEAAKDDGMGTDEWRETGWNTLEKFVNGEWVDIKNSPEWNNEKNRIIGELDQAEKDREDIRAKYDFSSAVDPEKLAEALFQVSKGTNDSDTDSYLSEIAEKLGHSEDSDLLNDPLKASKDLGLRGSPPYLATLVDIANQQLEWLGVIAEATTESIPPKKETQKQSVGQSPEGKKPSELATQLEGLGAGALGGVNAFLLGLRTMATQVMQFFQTVVNGISNIVTKVAKTISKTFITMMQSLGQGISGLFKALGSIPPQTLAIAAGALGSLTLALMGMGLALKMTAPFVNAVFGGIAKTLEVIGKVVKVVGNVIVNLIGSITENIIQLAQIPLRSYLSMAAGFMALGASLFWFGTQSWVAIPSLLALGVAADGLSKLFTVLPPDQMTLMADGFRNLAGAVREFGLSSLFLGPALGLLTALSAIPLVGKLIELQMSNQEKLKSGGETKVFKAETLEVDHAQGLGSSGSWLSKLFGQKEDMDIENGSTSSSTDNSIGSVINAPTSNTIVQPEVSFDPNLVKTMQTIAIV